MKIWEFLEKNGPDVWVKEYHGLDRKNQRSLAVGDIEIGDGDCFCLDGLLYKFYNFPDRILIREKIAERISFDIFTWNDAPERTFEEVLFLCKELDI